MKQTHWQVITGAPCSGKTTLIEALEARGYSVVHELARAQIQRELAKGRTLAEIKAGALAFQGHILAEKIRTEAAFSPDQRLFFDRALPDSIAYFTLHGLDTGPIFQACQRFRYQAVFLLQRFPFQADGVRSEDEAIAQKLESLVIDAYEGLGYRLIHVPRMPLARRVEFVLESLESSVS